MSDLRGTNTPGRVQFGTSGKIVGAALVLCGICVLAAYGYETGQFNTTPKPAVSDNQLPTTAAPSGVGE